MLQSPETESEQNQTSKDKATRHPEFYFDDKYLIFQVENTLFRVRSLYFQTSPIFRDMLSLKAPEGAVQDGDTDESPIKLEGEKADSFAFILLGFGKSTSTQIRESVESKSSSLVNNCSHGCPVQGSVDDWFALFYFGHKYQMTNVQEAALAELQKHKWNVIEMINFGEKYEIEYLWAAKAFRAMCAEPISSSLETRLVLAENFRPKTIALLSVLREKRAADMERYYSNKCSSCNSSRYDCRCMPRIELVQEWIRGACAISSDEPEAKS